MLLSFSQAISDKVTAALAEKLDLLRFNEFKLQVRAILADVEDRLRDWSPISGGIKAPLDGSTGTAGASSCLLCDRRVRSSAEMKQTQPAILTAADRIFAPEKVPESILPSISEKSGSPSAANNAKILSRKKDTAALLNQLSATMPESVPSSPKSQPGTMMGTANLLDMSGLISGNPNRVEVETISGTIAAGKLPTKSAGGASRLKDAKASEADPDPNAISNVIKIGK